MRDRCFQRECSVATVVDINPAGVRHEVDRLSVHVDPTTRCMPLRSPVEPSFPMSKRGTGNPPLEHEAGVVIGSLEW